MSTAQKPLEDNLLSFELTTHELGFLLGLFDCDQVVGFNNPFEGWLIEEIEQAHSNALDSLVQEKFVEVSGGTQIILDEVIALMTWTMAQAEHTAVIQKGLDKEPQFAIYFNKESIVLWKKVVGSKNVISIIKDKEALITQLSQELEIPSKVNKKNSSFSLAEDILIEIGQLQKAGETRIPQNKIDSLGIENTSSKQIIHALTVPQSNVFAVSFNNQKDESARFTRDIGYIESEDGIWFINSRSQDGEKIIEFAPADVDIFHEQFAYLLPN